MTNYGDFLRRLPWEGVIGMDQLMTYALPAYGGASLPEAAQTLLAEPSDAETVLLLLAELRSSWSRLFRSAIRLELPGPQSAQEGEDAFRPRVVNGMHRIAAARLAGVSRILVTSSPDDSAAENPDAELVEVTFRVPGHSRADLAERWLRSLPLTADVWVEAPGVAQIDGVYEMVYDCPHEHVATLVAALQAAAGRHGGAALQELTTTATSRRLLSHRRDAEAATRRLRR